MKIRVPIAACAAGAMLLAACSDLRPDYRRNEQVLAWTVRSYVSLDSSQERLLDGQLDSLRRWHCESKAGAHAAWVRRAAADFTPALTPDLVAVRAGGLEYFARQAVAEVVPRAATVLQSLSERQARELGRNLEHAAAASHPFVSGPEREQRLRHHLQAWLGPLTPVQQRLVTEWSTAVRPVGTDLYASSALPVIALRSILRQRTNRPVLESELRAILLAPDRWWTRAGDPRFAANRLATWQLLTRIAASSTPDQRRRLLQKAEVIAAGLEHDACDARR